MNTTPVPKHYCAAILADGKRCPWMIDRKILMCGEHYKLVPIEIQIRISRAYQQKHRANYREASREAIQAVKAKLQGIAAEKAQTSEQPSLL